MRQERHYDDVAAVSGIHDILLVVDDKAVVDYDDDDGQVHRSHSMSFFHSLELHYH